MKDKEFLNWLADRLIHVYGESEFTDFVIKLKAIARNADPDQISVNQTACEYCGGEGRVRVGERLVSREMALDAGDRTLEGSHYEYEYEDCPKCEGKARR